MAGRYTALLGSCRSARQGPTCGISSPGHPGQGYKGLGQSVLGSGSFCGSWWVSAGLPGEHTVSTAAGRAGWEGSGGPVAAMWWGCWGDACVPIPVPVLGVAALSQPLAQLMDSTFVLRPTLNTRWSGAEAEAVL